MQSIEKASESLIRISRTVRAYGANFDRLIAVKAKYDPTNFFRMNQNIKPAL